MVKIDLFMSDLHIGSEFFHDEDSLKAVLENNYHQRYLLGDIIDTYDYPLSFVIDKYRDLIEFINNLNPIIILGNHDPSIEVMSSLFPSCSIYEKQLIQIINYKRTMIMHGDRYNFTCKVYHVLSGILRDRKWRKRLQKFYMIHNYKQYENKILAWDEQRTIKNLKDKYERIIMGHTHTPKIIKTPHLTYINTGCWLYKPSFIEYDYDSRNFKLIWA